MTEKIISQGESPRLPRSNKEKEAKHALRPSVSNPTSYRSCSIWIGAYARGLLWYGVNTFISSCIRPNCPIGFKDVFRPGILSKVSYLDVGLTPSTEILRSALCVFLFAPCSHLSSILDSRSSPLSPQSSLLIPHASVLTS